MSSVMQTRQRGTRLGTLGTAQMTRRQDPTGNPCHMTTGPTRRMQMHTETRLSRSKNRSGPLMRGPNHGAIFAVAALGCLAILTPSGLLRATTLAQTQLKGLTGVNLYVHVEPDI